MDFEKYITWMEELNSVGLVTDTQLVHLRIKSEFNTLKEEKMISVAKAEEILSEKYYLSISTVHCIIYPGSRKKSGYDMSQAKIIY